MKRLGICIAGLDGAVASTFVAGVALMRRGLTRPLALISETYQRSHDLAQFDSFVFGGWDVRGENVYESALRSRVLDVARLQPVAKELTALKPFSTASKPAKDIETFRRKHKLDTVIVLNLLPTAAHNASQACRTSSGASVSPSLRRYQTRWRSLQ